MKIIKKYKKNHTTTLIFWKLQPKNVRKKSVWTLLATLNRLVGSLLHLEVILLGIDLKKWQKYHRDLK